MTKSKKLLNMFLAVAIALLTFGMALAFILPSLNQNKSSGTLQTVEATSADDVLSSLPINYYESQPFYEISTAEQLAALSFKISVENNTTWASRNFELANDINLQTNSVIWTPIGTSTNPFKGKFNGNGYTISGLVAGFDGSIDENLGLFGKVSGESASNPAMIYDIVLDDFAFADYVQNPETSGRLIGYIENAVLLDVYDLSYVLSGSFDVNRPLKTIGTVGDNVKIYIGDSFIWNKSSTNTEYIPGVNYDPMQGGTVSKVQFDWAAGGQPSFVGYSLLVRGATSATVYEKGDSAKTSITPFRIAVNNDGSALTVYSKNYYKELPQENEINAVNGQPIIEPVEGMKLNGWKLADNDDFYTNISGIPSSKMLNSYLYLEANLKSLTYTLNIVQEISTGAIVQIGTVSVPANKEWSKVISEIEAKKSGYFLTDLYQDTTHYYTNSISYDDSWNVIDNKAYPSGSRVNNWSDASRTLYSEWIGKVSNATIKFTNANDSGAKLDSMTNLSIVYTDGEPVNSPDLALQRSNDVLGEYTFKAIADQNLTFAFTLPAGYVAKTPTNNQGGAVLSGGTDGVYSVAINGLLTSGGVVTIPIEREQISLNISAPNFTISISGQSSFTTLSSNVIKTRVGESFNIVATPASGYEYASHNVTTGFTTISTPTVASNDVATFPVTVNTFEDSQVLTISAKAKAFTIILDYDATAYATGVQLPEVIISDGIHTVSTSSDAQWDNFTPSGVVTITSTGNAYFNAGVVTLETTSAGSISGSNGNYQIIPPSGESLIPGGSVFKIKVSFSAKQYSATYDGKFATVNGSGTGSTASNFTSIKDINGSGITNSNQVIQITADTAYVFGDKITLSYNIVSDYYEFIGWYYSNGNYISNQNNAQVTAGTNNMTIYAVVKGKTATFNVATGSLIKNYDGTTSSYDKGVALSTPNVNSVSFTYGTPSSGAVSFTLTKGYNGGEYILYNASSSGNPFEQYESGTAFLVTTLGNSISGYNSLKFAQNQNAESVFFDHAGWTLYPIVMQRTISVQAAAGDGSVVSGSESATSVRLYYYGGDGFDISYAINAFKKTGYTASGWSFVLGGQTHNVTDSNILSQGKYLIDFASFNGIDTYLSSSGTITVNRTYSANTYKLYFNQNSGEVLNTTELKHDSTGYYKEVVYDQQIGKLPSITKQGYVFAGWGVNATDLYQTDGNKTVNASWTNQSYVVQINFNGGKVSGQNTMNVNVTYDGSIGTFNEYTANGLASLASLVQRDGFVFDAWHYMVPTTTGDGTTYQYVKEVSDTDILNSSTFAYANFDNTTDPVVYIYAGWQFDESDYSASVSVNNKTYDNNFVTFNVSVSANGTSYPLSSSQTNLPTNAGVKISSFNWEFNGSPFTGTAYSYGPQIKNVSESGNYEVTFVLSDSSSINVVGIAPQSISIKASCDVEIKQKNLASSIRMDISEDDDVFSYIKNLVEKTKPYLELFDGGDGYLQAVLNATTSAEIATWLSDTGSENALVYVLSKPIVTLLAMNNNFKADLIYMFENSEFGLYDETLNLLKSIINEVTPEFVENNYKTITAFDNWFNNVQEDAYDALFTYLGAFFSKTVKFYDGTYTLYPWQNFKIINEPEVILGSTAYYVDIVHDEGGIAFNANPGVRGFAVEIIAADSANPVDMNNFENVVLYDGKYYVVNYPYDINIDVTNSNRLDYSAPFIITAPTALYMTETNAVEKGSAYEFELTAEYTHTNELTKIVANVSTTSGDAGVYSFINGNLVINSFRAYVDDENYFTVENQDGAFVVTGAPSGMETTDLNLNNLLLYVAGNFEIVSPNTTNTIDFDSVVISAKDSHDGITVQNITEGNEYNLSISSVRVEIGGSAEDISVTLDKEIYYSNDGTFVFQIIGNGTRTPVVYASSYVTNITVSVSNLNPQANRHLLSVVEWQEGESYYSDLLKGASTFASNLSKPMEIGLDGVGESLSIVAVYSDATYVTLSSVTDKGSNANFINGNAYVNFDDQEYTVPNTANNAYVLTEWTSVQGATVDESGVVTFNATPNTSLVAHYKLAEPVGSVKDAEPDASENDTAVNTLISNITITNTDPAINYTYKWFRLVDGEYQQVSSLVSSTAGNGEYAVEVTANQTGYNSATSQKLKFNITFNKVDLTITNNSTETLTYNNQNFATSYQINYKIGEQSYSMTVSEALNNNAVADGDKLIITSLQKDGSNVTSIKDVGEYTLSFSLFDYSGNDYNPQKIYNLVGTATITITVEQKEVILSKSDASFSKKYGERDPLLQKSVNGVNGETFVVTYKRETGEAVGDYAITEPTSQNANYKVVLPSNDDWFTITPREGLVLSADISGNVTHVYNNAGSTGITATYNSASNSFTLEVQGTGEWIGNLTLNNFKETSSDGLSRTVNAFEDMLDGFTFTVNGTKNVGNYTISVVGTSTYSGASFSINNASSKVVSITKLDVQLSAENSAISKVYGEDDNLTKLITVESTGESFNVTFTRKEGEDVGPYKYLTASFDNGNYNPVLPEDANWFTILAIEDLIIQTEITEVYSRIYDATAPDANVAISYVGGQWRLTVSSGATTWKVFVLSNFKEISEEKSINRVITPNETTLAGMTFSIQNPQKHVGNYSISALKTGENVNYQGLTLVGGENVIQITQATITIKQSDIQQSSKVYGSKDPEMLWAVDGAGSEKVNVQFVRDTGEDVGTYKINSAKIKDDTLKNNYIVSLPNNIVFTIEPYSNLQISATATDPNVTFIYNGQVPTISLQYVDVNSYKLLLTCGDQNDEIILNNFVEKFEADKSINGNVSEKTLQGITFYIENVAKDKGVYEIKASGSNLNYPGGFKFANSTYITVRIQPAEIQINSADYEQPMFVKDYGSADPLLRKQFDGVNGEKVYIRFTREGEGTLEGERVGPYDLLTPVSEDANYTAVISPETNNNLFEIKALSGLVLRGEIVGETISQIYNGKSLQEAVDVTWNDADKNFTLTVKYQDGSVFGTFVLDNFDAIDTEQGDSSQEVTDITANMLDGLTFKVDGYAKDAKTYSIIVSGQTNTYSSFIFANSSALIKIEPKNIELNISNSSFEKTYGKLDRTTFENGLVKTIDGVADETFDVVYTREPGENVGKYAILSAQSQDDNYTVTLSGGLVDGDRDWFTITAIKDLTLTATVTGGAITHEFVNEAPSASLQYIGGTWTIIISSESGEWGRLTLIDFKESSIDQFDFVNENGFVVDSSTLSQLKIDVLDSSVNVEDYDLTITTQINNVNYPNGFAFTVGHTDAISITKATYNVTESSADFTTQYGSEESKTTVFTRTVTGINDYQFEIKFTRTYGTDVDVYEITDAVTTDANYQVAPVSTPNEWYSVTAVSGLTFSATASVHNVELTYNNSIPTISTKFVDLGEDSYWQIVISNGVQSQTIDLNDFIENFENPVSITDVETLRAIFDDVTFSLQDIKKDVGVYSVVADCKDANYPGGFVFGTVSLTVKPAPLTIESKKPLLNKVYGSVDPDTYSYTFESEFGESVEVTFDREDGESVGTYDLIDPQSQDDNYEAVINPVSGNDLFEITAQAGLTLSVAINGDQIVRDYDGEKDISVVAEFDTESNSWILKVMLAGQDEPLGVYTLSEFNEVNGDIKTPVRNVDASTLNGFTFKFDRSVKDVGTYTIVMDSNSNPNYPGGIVFSNSADVLQISAKELSVSDITKEFDQKAAFNTSNSDYTNTATITGLVGDETVVLTGQFTSIGVGSDITINNLEISGEYASNYRLEKTSSTGNIIKNTTDVIIINLDDTEYTYGEINNTLSAFAPTAKLNDNSVASYANITPNIATASYSLGGFLKQGTYSVEFIVTSDYYTVENYTVEITVSTLDITVSVDGEITKVYDRNTNVVQSLLLQTVLSGDEVTVSGTYDNEQPGEDKVVTFALAGADADNYNLTNRSSTGTIERAVIKITAELDTETDGFVDGTSATGTTSFEISYPLVGSGEETLAILTAPNKTGYNFMGWTYGEDRTALTAENIDTALDDALDSKALTIYADWDIQTFTVTININKEQGSYTISPEKVGEGDVYTYNYWDTITITGVPNTGYIARSAQTITNISSNQEVNVEFTPATITFTVSVDRNSLYPTGSAVVEFPSQDWVAQGSAAAARSILFNALDGVLAKDFLPQINVYGYTLASWNSADTVINVEDETTLLDIILMLNNSFNENISLDFNANFTANEHNLLFNTDGGTPQPENMSVTYGQVVGVLPTVTKTGYGFIAWVDDEGQIYTQDTIFAVDGDVNLTATWGVGIYDFTVNVGHAKVEIRDTDNSVMTADGNVYRLSYTQTYTITVTPDAGYEISGAWTESEPDTFDLEYTTEYTKATLKNLSGAGSITVPTQASDNIITINIDKADVDVTVDGEPVEGNVENGMFTFTAKTDTVVEITVSPNAGYTVDFDEISEGTGTILETSENVYSLSGFTSDVTIDFIATANTYNATFTYEGGASGVSIISGGSVVAGNNIQVSTGIDLVIAPNFEYGYEFASVSANGATYNVDNETGYITFSEFTQSFTVTITGKAKSFGLSATVFVLDSDKNVQDPTGFNATVSETGLFGSEVTFTASKPQEATGYRFIGWFEGILQAEDGVLNYNLDSVVSTDESYVWTISGDRDLTAVYEYGVFTIRAYVEGKGQIVYQNDIVADSEDGSYFSQQFNYSQTLVLTAQPASGYEFLAWMNGEEQYSTSKELEITVQNDLSLTATFVPGDLTFTLEPGVLINGVLNTGTNITGLNYGSVVWGSYDEENGFVEDENGTSTTVASKTNESVYVKVTVNQGYEFDNIYPTITSKQAEINLVVKDETQPNQLVYIYELTGMSSEYSGQYNFVATFVAKATKFNIIFQEATADGGFRQVDAGQIYVESAAGINVSGNYSSSIGVNAVTGTTFNVVANIKIGMSFVDSDYVNSTAGTISAINIKPVDDIATGFTSTLTFTVSDFVGDEATIIIKVESASYTIQFIDIVNESENILGTLTDIKIGDTLTIPEGMSLPTKEGYSFLGFFASDSAVGDGNNYLNSDGVGVVWSENGYKWNTKGYEKLSNFTPSQDGAGGTFKLYAVYVLNRTSINISAVPSAIQNIPPTVGARVVITNLSDANSYMIDSEPFFVQVLYGAKINITAPYYENYEFAYWYIERIDEQGQQTTEIVKDVTIEGLSHYAYPQMQLVANYNAKVSVSGNKGGTVYYTYQVEGDDGITEVRVENEAFVPTDSSITLHAEAENGFNFLGWFVNDEFLSSEFVIQIDTPVLANNYVAKFEGKAVTIHIGEYDKTHGNIYSIMSNGSAIDYSSGYFQAKVGDEISLYVKIDDYFEVVWTGGEVENRGTRVYVYVVDYDDFTDSEMTLTPLFTQIKATVNIIITLKEIALGESQNLSEIQLAGKVSYINQEGTKTEVNGDAQFEALIGNAVQIEISALTNYKLSSVTFNNRDVTSDIVSNILIETLYPNLLNNTNFTIKITFERDLWIDSITDEYNLTGEGSSNNPYIISTVEDLAFVARMVNERENTSFANAHYKLGANLDLSGKYWSPIGTESNKFNGTFDYDIYGISGVSVVFGYSGELNRDGVFGYLGDKANITEASNDLMIALIIVGIVIFLILLALLIFLLVRRNRKKKLEELANG